jgi:hypothetical protein
MLPALLLTGGTAHAQDASGIVINGALEVNYTANFNKPSTGSNTYIYNKKEGQFAINLAQIQVSKPASPESRTGFLIRLVEGEVRRYNFNLGETSDGDPRALPFILEAYGTLFVPAGGKNLKIDAGQFISHVGYETIEVGANNFFSRSFLFQYPTPRYNTGVRVAVPLGSRTTATGLILNRFNGTNDTGNRDPGIGFQIAQTLGGTSSLVFNGLTARENLAYNGAGPDSSSSPGESTADLSRGRAVADDAINRQVSILDLVYGNQINSRLRFAAEGIYRFGKDTADRSYNITGGAGYLVYGLRGGNSIGLRAEHLRQSTRTAGVLPVGSGGGNPNLTSITLSYDLRSNLLPGSRTLAELRYDNSNQAVFGGENSFKKNQTTFTLGQILSF